MKARRAVTAADLQRLLDPNYEPFAKTTKLPPLPAYGKDPYDGSAPIILTPRQEAPQQTTQPVTQPTSQNLPWSSVPSTTEDQPGSAQDSNPAITTIPAAQAPGPLFIASNIGRNRRPAIQDGANLPIPASG